MGHQPDRPESTYISDYDAAVMRALGWGKPVTEGMSDPVLCNRCRTGVYDVGTVEVTASYADCSMWKAPCCGAVVDDRGETGWKTFKDYTRIDRSGADT